MKLSSLSLFLFLLCIAASCKESRSPYHDQVVAAAQRDVESVANTKEGTMEREKAVLSIRVREQSLRAHNLDAEADLYIETAGSLLVDSLHIIENRHSVDLCE